jgi:hypothetical protein
MDPGKERFPSATATTDSSGKYVLTHRGGQPGAPLGKYCVVVTNPPRGRDEIKLNVPIPLHYTAASDSPLTAEVKAGPRQTIDLPLVEE